MATKPSHLGWAANEDGNSSQTFPPWLGWEGGGSLHAWIKVSPGDGHRIGEIPEKNHLVGVSGFLHVPIGGFLGSQALPGCGTEVPS